MQSDPCQVPPQEGDALGDGPLRISFDAGPYAGQSFEAVLGVCRNPNCICSIVQMDCTPPARTPPGPDCPQWRIDLDVVKRTVRAAV